MTIKEFIIRSIIEHSHLFPFVKSSIAHEAIQHFYSGWAAYNMSLNHDINYFALQKIDNMPFLADGAFILNHATEINNFMPIHYKMRDPQALGDFSNYLIEHTRKYSNTSSIIELGVQNSDLFNTSNVLNLPSKVLIKNYSFLENQITPEIEKSINKYISYLENNFKSAMKVNEIYIENWSKIDVNNHSSILEIIKTTKKEL